MSTKLPKPAEVAAQEARRMALVLSEVGGEGASLGSGWMACDAPGSWADYTAGLGMGVSVDEETIDSLVTFYRDRDRVPRVQVSPHHDPSLLRGLKARGFTPYERESVFVHGLHDLPASTPVPGLSFRLVDPVNDEDVVAFRDSQMIGFFEGEEPPPGMLSITERVARASRCSIWLLEQDGTIVGSGGLERFEEAGVLIAGCVHPGARRQGIQSAFIRFRLAQAASAGLRYVTIGSLKGGPTARNAIRAGFSMSFELVGLERVEGHPA